MNTNTDISDRLGVILLKKGIVSANILSKALIIKENGGQKDGRNLAQILVKDFNADHASVFKEVTQLYGFREISLKDEDINEHRISFMRKMFDPLPEELRNLMKEEKILVYKYDPNRPYVVIILAADPTNQSLQKIARAIGAKRYEACYVPYHELESLIEKVSPEENVYLKDLDEMAEEIEEEDEWAKFDGF